MSRPRHRHLRPAALRPNQHFNAGSDGKGVDFFRASRAIFDLRGLGHSAKLVLLCLARHADDHGWGWPGIAKLAAECDLSANTVHRAIGVLMKTRHPRTGKPLVVRLRQRYPLSTEYVLLPLPSPSDPREREITNLEKTAPQVTQAEITNLVSLFSPKTGKQTNHNGTLSTLFHKYGDIF